MASGFKFDDKAFQLSVAKSDFLKSAARSLAEEVFEDKKDKLIEKFENHPVTKEIDQGPDAANISGTLGGYGNLFSFIGFDYSSSPLDIVRVALSRIRLRTSSPTVQVVGNKVEISYKVIDNDVKNLAGKTPMPWESGKSWLFSIERGISGFSNYLNGLFNASRSRSGAGVQSKNPTRSGTFKNTSYFSKMYNDFVKSLGIKN